MLCFERKLVDSKMFEPLNIIILIMASEKEGNNYDLKEIENYCREKTCPKRPVNYITKRADLPLQIRIVKLTSFMISTNGQAILVTQKQCQLILGEPQHT